MKKNRFNDIVEKKLGIPADYQYNALHNANFLQSNWHANKLTAIDQTLILNKQICVLDLGAGSGNFEILYGKKVKQISAVDYHKEALDFLSSYLQKKKVKNIRYIHSDIRELDKIKNLGKYDIVLLIDVIEHIQKKEAVVLIKYLKSVFKDKGFVCIITPNYKSLWIYIEEILDKFTIVPHFGGHQHLAQYYPSNLRELFEKNGFKTKTIKTFNFFSFLLPFRIFSTYFCKLELLSNFKYGNLLLGVFSYEKK